jgi:hypothetical protein
MRNDKDQSQRTNDIIDRLEALSIETNELVTELRRREQLPQAAVVTPTSVRTKSHGFVVGDRASITNNYLRQRNIQGHVIYATAQRVTIIDAQGNRYTRKPTNLRKL